MATKAQILADIAAYVTQNTTNSNRGDRLNQILQDITNITTDIKSIAIALTSGDMATISSVPVAIIPTPGNGCVIEIISAFVEVAANSTPYDSSCEICIGNTDVVFGTASGQLRTVPSVLTTAGIYKCGTDTSWNTGSTPGVLKEDEPIYVFGGPSGVDPTVGDYQVNLYIEYRIVNLF